MDTLPAALFLLLTPFMLIMLVCCANQDPNQERNMAALLRVSENKGVPSFGVLRIRILLFRVLY